MRFEQKDVAPGEARQFADEWSAAHGHSSSTTSDLALIVSELVSNAVRHGVGPYSIELRQQDGVIRGEVSDGSTTPPVLNAKPDESGGFGLGIVTACASKWGTNIDATGKHIWFEIQTDR